MKNENYRLIKLAQSGDKDALEMLTIKNKGLIWCMVKKFSGRGIENDDLFQIGAIGLSKAICKFDTSFDVEFSTYAVPMILGEMRRFLRDDGIIKVSRSLKETAMKARMAAERISLQKGEEATLTEIASELNCEVGEITIALEATAEPESIFKSIHEGDSSPVLLIDKISTGENKEGEIIDLICLREEIKKLPPRERQILMLRFYKEKTQSEVAKIMGLSQVQISRIEKKVLSNLKKNIS